jgi:hypothetical protein
MLEQRRLFASFDSDASQHHKSVAVETRDRVPVSNPEIIDRRPRSLKKARPNPRQKRDRTDQNKVTSSAMALRIREAESRLPRHLRDWQTDYSPESSSVNLNTRNRPTQNALAHAMLIAAVGTNAGA